MSALKRNTAILMTGLAAAGTGFLGGNALGNALADQQKQRSDLAEYCATQLKEHTVLGPIPDGCKDTLLTREEIQLKPQNTDDGVAFYLPSSETVRAVARDYSDNATEAKLSAQGGILMLSVSLWGAIVALGIRRPEDLPAVRRRHI